MTVALRKRGGDWFSASYRSAKYRSELAERMALKFKIERGIPIPPPGRHKVPISGVSFVLKRLQRGDSVWLPRHQTLVAHYARRYLGVGCYAVRTMGGGTRVWRTK